MVSKNMIRRTAAALTTRPADPIWNGPFGIYFLPVKTFGAMAMAYDVDVRMIKDPAKTVNAVGLPRGIAPRPVEIMAQSSVAGIGQLRRSLTLEKKCAKGVASSRARDHQMRPHVRSVPTRQIRRETKTIIRRQNVPPLVPVACA
jgi:hypothetical protein